MGVAAPATAAEAADMVLTGLRYLAVTAAACEVHHLTHLADGGTTKRGRLRVVLLFPPPRGHSPVGLDRRPAPRRHHHRPQPDGTKVFHSHKPNAPPARAG
jgi:hypothetical protein